MLTMTCNQDRDLVRKLQEKATGVRRDTALQHLIGVFDILVQLVVERTTLHGNVMIGGAARLWQQLIHASLLDGMNRDNTPHVLRDILISFGQWLERSSFYAQAAGPRNACTTLIQVNPIPVLRSTVSPHSYRLQEMLLVLPSPSPHRQRLKDWQSRKRVKREDSRKGIVKADEL